MIILDTNVVSELLRKAPELRVVEWVDRIPASELALTAVTSAELMYGIARLPDGRRKRALHSAVTEVLAEDFAGRVLPFDALASAHYGQIAADRARSGRPISMADGQIAAICRTWGTRLATRNVDDFAGTGVDVLDPWAVAID